MEFSANERQIMNALNFDYYVLAASLAKQLFVSDKTIRRRVKHINEIFAERYDRPLILSQSGKGFQLDDYFKSKELYLQLEKGKTKFELSLDEILLSLLFSHPNKRQHSSLQDNYFSESSKRRRFRQMRARLEHYQLQLYENSDYVWIVGDEIHVRKAINDLIMTIDQHSNLNHIGLDLYPADNAFIDKQIEFIEEKSYQYLNYPYDVMIIAHLYMLVKRVREGKVQGLSSGENQIDTDLMKVNSDLLSIAQDVINNLSNYLSVKLSESEVYYVFQTLYAINLKRRESSQVDKELAEIVTKKLVTVYFNISDVTLLQQSRSLYEDLYQHILPMLSRLRLGIRIENNLLDEVRLKYAMTFNKLKKIVDVMNQELAFDIKIDEAEIGYLVLYFEKYHLETKAEKHVLLVCSTGIGTSELLKVRLQAKIPNLDVVATMSGRQADKNKNFIKQNVNLILSTTATVLNNVDNIPMLTISPLLTEKDIQKIYYLLEKNEVTK